MYDKTDNYQGGNSYGTNNQNYQPTVSNEYGGNFQQQKDPSADQLSMILFVVGFLVPIVCIVNWAIHKDSHSDDAKRFARYSCNAFLAYVCLIVSLVVILVVLPFACWLIIMIFIAIVGAIFGNNPIPSEKILKSLKLQ
jgi:hypothetical protein